ncbi:MULTISPECIES: glycosyltransferase family 4 protein [Dictyoglomus]|uniref:Glycosyl transferase group 1 n=1 Tax=Dictyoglomus turgidum (strain DSM 6724 / Z-1310) TaxID=515635 RepID=B8E0Y7_DICTD|nr:MULTISPECIES: glycosyltransferase family 4 protein [Dictyoglomus]ACK42724.1 glycosyl transferase group 1 [Dictyoglomus turgidum DSM 6724]HBU30783.1 glycosyl transferase family 1 [Dictyoglomus sp.]
MIRNYLDKINVAFLSTYPPRACGLATFTEDLIKEIDKIAPLYNPYVDTSVIAVSDDKYTYDTKVIKEINQFNKVDYFELAQYLNDSDIDLLVIQHEYGIFGGESGEYLLDLIYHLKIPFITVLHTVLINPSDKQKYVLKEIGKYSTRVVTMAKNTIELLENIYDIDRRKIVHIPHGVPYIYYGERENLKKELGLEGKIVVSTFGLIGPGKGLEYGIEAIAKLKNEFPNIVYLILGRTHPGIVKNEGESYREKLLKMVENLGVKENVLFVNRYLTQEEILKYLQASDIYMTPYLNKEQAVSGTLSYALSCGRVIVSTAYRYAEELLADGRGILVEFRDSEGIYRAIRDVLNNEEKRKEIERKAFKYGKSMWWNVVAEKYITLFHEVILEKNAEIGGWKKWSFSTLELTTYSD